MSTSRYLLFYRQNEICDKLFDELNKTPELKSLILFQNYDTWLKENNEQTPEWLKGLPTLYEQSSGRTWNGLAAILGQVQELLRETQPQSQTTYKSESSYNSQKRVFDIQLRTRIYVQQKINSCL